MLPVSQSVLLLKARLETSQSRPFKVTTMYQGFSNHPRAYGSAALAIAFVAGILVTLGFKDLYPDLEGTYQQKRKRPSGRRWSASTLAARRSSLFFFQPVQLEDHESDSQQDADFHTNGNSPPPIADGIEGTIGNTPLLRIRSLSELTGRTILAKAEFLNGAGNSPKDRVALSIIRAAEDAGQLTPGSSGDTIYEGTVGSTGISLATLARARGYKAHICMPNDQSTEKSDYLIQLGATVERVPVAPITSPSHFVNLARQRAKEHTPETSADGSRGFFADQFETGANHAAHYATTGPEIVLQTEGRVDAFVAGAGTGGTISGVARYLKLGAKVPGVKVVLADPQGSGLYNKIKHGSTLR